MNMISTIIDFANLLLAALLVGALFGVWLSFNPVGLDAGSWIAQQQHGIRAMNGRMPVLGGVTLLVTIAATALAYSDRTRFVMLVAAAISLLAAGLITRFLNQPINAIVITWSVETPPANWAQLRDSWWYWHMMRLAAGLIGLCLLIAAALKPTIG